MQPDVTQAAVGRWPSILQQLGVEESFLRNKHGPCPSCGGTDRYRFDDRDGTGSFFCSHCGAGDGFTLLMRLKGVDFKGAADLVRELIPSTKAAPVEEKSDSREKVRKLWAESQAVVAGDAVWCYLESRGVLPDVMPEEIRCAHSVRYYEERECVGSYPAMLARVRDQNGTPKTLHCTYLDGKGGKAAVGSPKKVLSPSGSGAAIRLYRASSHVCLSEGIESALAVHKKIGRPVWSCLSAGGMQGWICPPEIKSVEIWADADRNYVGQLAAFTLAYRLVKEGKDAAVYIPAIGTDWAMTEQR